MRANKKNILTTARHTPSGSAHLCLVIFRQTAANWWQFFPSTATHSTLRRPTLNTRIWPCRCERLVYLPRYHTVPMGMVLKIFYTFVDSTGSSSHWSCSTRKKGRPCSPVMARWRDHWRNLCGAWDAQVYRYAYRRASSPSVSETMKWNRPTEKVHQLTSKCTVAAVKTFPLSACLVAQRNKRLTKHHLQREEIKKIN